MSHFSSKIALACLTFSVMLIHDAHADNYTFSEIINNQTVSGTFTGVNDTNDNNIIEQISNFSFTIQGDTSTTTVNNIFQTNGSTITNSQLSYNGQNNSLLITDPTKTYGFESISSRYAIYFPYQIVVNADVGIISMISDPISWKVTDTTAAVPEPETYTMFAVGLLGLGLARRKVVQA